MQVGELGEFALIARLQRFLPDVAQADSTSGGAVVRGIGDDCAVVQPSPGAELLLTTDTQEENVHFRRDWSTAEDIGWRCLAVNVSDIAAMAGAPLGALVALSLPANLDVRFVDGLYEGMQALALETGCPIIGGNITKSSTNVSVTITVLGEVPQGQGGYRSGARTGDEIWVTGTLGAAKAGLEALIHADRVALESCPFALSRYRRPTPRLREAQYLRQQGVLHSLLDISDGVSSDLRHICAASGVGAELEAERIPMHDQVVQVAEALQANPLDYALHGGEDFELCFTTPPDQLVAVKSNFEQQFQCDLVRVGTIQPGAGVVLSKPDGSRIPLEVQGYDHFRNSSPSSLSASAAEENDLSQ